ncbi:spore coat protein, partial [Priestia megaterium]|uniref:spore coat protein n=1 Tax=Priestia megaterium TaxID=1404 RepID=UPI00164984FF
SIQVGLEIAIAPVVGIRMGDNVEGKRVVGEVKELGRIKEKNCEKTIIEKCRNVNVRGSERDMGVNVEVVLEVLMAMLVIGVSCCVIR